MEEQTVFQSKDGKRRVLVVEDEAVNRAILGGLLEQEYEVIFAEDGLTALEKIRENKELLSLVILDLIMPGMSGVEVLRQIRAESAYQDIPVIVASGDQAREIECLQIGASDFIQKPYPEPGVILARVRRTIELFEGRRIIQSTERDPLTGLYNREFFYSYAEQFDQRHPDMEMDAILLDINHFSTINERYGRAYADDVLRRVGEKAREMVHDAGGIVCRREADIFQVYCPHREDYKAILDNASQGLAGELDANNRIRLRMGVYSRVDKSLELERRFDRAKMAADTVRNSYTRDIGVYDDSLHRAELYSMQLIEDFPTAIQEKQFQVYFQPKYDIRGPKPRIAGAEALVRWQHPELGMVSPGVFIPLFEENGLIQALDQYVWREAALQVRAWKEELGYCVPVSVNISRVDMSDSKIVEILQEILETSRLDAADLHLEVTESAYAEDAEQIIEVVMRLRAMGFLVEMDDFGTGYSSLNMLSTLPIDVLKLDMKFIQTAFAQEGNLEMLGIIMNIARHLAVPVVAEGVETEEQLKALKDLGCDLVQGYFFSPPVPAEKFQPFLLEPRAIAQKDAEEKEKVQPAEGKEGFSLLRRWSERLSIPMSRASFVFVLVAFLVATGLYVADSMVTHGYLRMEQASERYILAQQAATNLEMGSDDLTDSVRSFVVTGKIDYLQDYFEEAEVARRRDKAVEDLQSMLEGEDTAALENLSRALSLSNDLMDQEYQAMRYILAAGEYDAALIPEALREVPLPAEASAAGTEELQALAKELVFGQEYMDQKAQIMESANLCTQELIEISNRERIHSGQRMDALLTIQTVLTIALLAVVLVIVLFINGWIRRPLSNMVKQMQEKRVIAPTGAEELRFVSKTYNDIFEENRRTHERLTYGNMHDALTGLYNRSAYNFMRHDLDMSHNALLLVDVDKFKSINDTYGHDVGDLVLKRVAEVLKYSFRSTDLVFRLGGDEFVVIMVNVNSTMRDLVKTKIEQANVMLQKPKEDLPPTSLSVGVAFADREHPEGDIFKDADTALYRVKEAGRCGCYIY
ncbi:MAG: EAL domain-containing protein [Clostridia bacterium]|nr:EAL domain-containing protein [Clostridia bacterium]